MIKIQGMELNFEKSSDGTNGSSWQLYFNRGLFSNSSGSMIRFTEPTVVKLKKKDYDYSKPKGFYLYYNPNNNKFSIVENNEDLSCEEPGYSIGGFLIKNCKMYFVYPKSCEGIEYRRSFDDAYNDAYNNLSINCDTPDEVLEEVCGEFREMNFNNDYNIDCVIFETSENEFNACEFNPNEFESDEECPIP
jgi:hypothetical protein